MNADSIPARHRIVAFGFLLLLSGFCGISYEILYARILSNFIGDQFAISASVLITFLAGVGLGSLYAHRLWRWLFLIEALVGACGLIFATVAPWFAQWFSSTVPAGAGLGASMLACVLLLCVPAFLIGCSLPLFGGYLQRLGSDSAFHKAYAIYNLGAGLTVLVVEFFLLRALGIQATVMTMAALNGLTAITLAFGFPGLRDHRPISEEPQRIATHELIALVLAGVASAIFQLLMVKLAECVFGPFRETFAIVVALILLGIALGSYLVKRFRVGFASLLLIGLAGLAWILGGLTLVSYGYAALYDAAPPAYAIRIALKVAGVAALMIVPATAFGATIPALIGARGDLARDSGRLLFVSSAANVLGFLLMAFALHRFFDYGVLVLVIAGIAAGGVLVYGRFRGRAALAAAALLVAAVALHRFRWDENLLYIEYSNFESVEDIDDARRKMRPVLRFKGYQDVFSLVEQDDNVSFFINGYVSVDLGSSSEPLIGSLAALLAPRTDKALVLGLGSGMTAGAVALMYDHVDSVEINPTVVENLWRMKRWNFNAETLPSMRIHVDDGVHFMKTSTEKYDLILNTVTTPRYFSASKLYTKDFFEIVRERLAPDGVYGTWVDSSIGDRGIDIVLSSLRESFSEAWLVALRSRYFLLACSNAPIGLRHPRSVVENDTLRSYFFEQAGMPAEWLPYSVLHTHAYDLIGDPAVPVNTNDRPALEFEVAETSSRTLDGFLGRLTNDLSAEKLASVIHPAVAYDAMDHILYLDMLTGASEIQDRYASLLEKQVPDFEKRRREARFEHIAGWALFGNTPLAHQEYGRMLSHRGRHEDAVLEYRKALQLEPRSRKSRISLAVELEATGDLDSADREYATIMASEPSDHWLSFRRGRIALRLRRHEDAERFLTTAAAYYAESAEVHYALGQAQEALGKLEPARRSFERALAMGPDDPNGPDNEKVAAEIAAALARVRAAQLR